MSFKPIPLTTTGSPFFVSEVKAPRQAPWEKRWWWAGDWGVWAQRTSRRVVPIRGQCALEEWRALFQEAETVTTKVLPATSTVQEGVAPNDSILSSKLYLCLKQGGAIPGLYLSRKKNGNSTVGKKRTEENLVPRKPDPLDGPAKTAWGRRNVGLNSRACALCCIYFLRE